MLEDNYEENSYLTYIIGTFTFDLHKKINIITFGWGYIINTMFVHKVQRSLGGELLTHYIRINYYFAVKSLNSLNLHCVGNFFN